MLHPPSVPRLLYRVLRISCPACGRGRIFRRFFLRAEKCAGCGRPFEREEGYWVGGSEVHMFASFGLSVILCVPFLVLFPPTPLLQACVLAGHVAISVAIFRYSRALFLAVDFYLDPGMPAADEGDPGGGLGVPQRPSPLPGHARRVPGRRGGSRRGRQPAEVR